MFAQMLRQIVLPSFTSSLCLALCAAAAQAKDPVEAARDLATTSQTDPNGLTLMIVSICMLFVFALSLIIATSVHAFKKKPTRKSTTTAKEVSPAGL